MVVSTIRGYGDCLWSEVVERVDAMGQQVNDFQTQCKRLPKVRRMCQPPPDNSAVSRVRHRPPVHQLIIQVALSGSAGAARLAGVQ